MAEAGELIGPYRLVAPAGAGGMGQVWRASDPRLSRTVAVKILPDSSERDLRARFEQEARAASALQHASIVSVYDVGVSGETPYIVSEFIEGETLRHLMQRGPVPVKRALDIAAQIADGLAAAHAAGITHRDLKPENIMITADGRAKILDFGLAKRSPETASRVSPDNPTESYHSEPGMIMGTANYMSPEQARGLAVDARSDQFSFGIVLHEMLTGKQPFRRDSGPQTMAAIIAEEAPPLGPAIPTPLRWVVERCLEKEPSQRYASTADLFHDLRNMRDHLTDLSSQPVNGHSRTVSRSVIPWIAAAASGLAIGAMVMLTLSRPSNEVDAVEMVPFAAESATETSPAFSPDGQSVAYWRGGDEVWVRSIRGSDSVLVATGAQSRPLWTHDGSRICYKNGREFWCVSASGGAPRKVLDDAGISAQFTPDGNGLIFIEPAGERPHVWISSPVGSKPIRMENVEMPVRADVLFPFSPDGKKLAVRNVAQEISVLDFPNGKPRMVAAGTGFDWLSDSRHGVFSAESEGFQAIHLIDTQSSARRLLLRGAAQLAATAVSPDGRKIMFSTGLADWDITEYTMDGRRVRALAATTLRELFPTWSPVEERFAYVSFEGRLPAIWTRSSSGGEPLVLAEVDVPMGPISPTWSPDGKRIAFAVPGELKTVRAMGGQPVRIASTRGLVGEICWSADGEAIWYSTRGRLSRVSGQGGEPQLVKQVEGPQLACSPDGKWIAYQKRDGIHLMSPEGAGDRILIPGPLGQGRVQFGSGSTVLYHLDSARREINVWDVATARKIRAIVLDLPPGELVNRFQVHPDGKRLLLQQGRIAYDLWTIENFAQPAPVWKRWFQHWEVPDRAAAQRREE